ncbi:uncharacterized protein LOC121504856 [Cheilinus undulatus]|uniref:uncharacterized protein LOC121504856 n=1 Tax=Cheilinus undulatus TaxID=241271 RepID=UPI001BD3ED9F|nr:uncharacterized protein LOC121504856 [Cheilinus undulatus]
MMPLHIFLLLLCETYQGAATGIIQDSGLKTAILGQTVTLNCSYDYESVSFLSWYHQRLGGKPAIVSTQMKHKPKASIFPAYEERFQVFAQEGKNNLIIRGVGMNDSGTYYCGVLEFNTIEFGQGVFLHVRSSSSNTQGAIRQPVLEQVWTGDSVNLSCKINVAPCAGGQSFYWVRHGSAQPVVVFHSPGQCGDPGKECTSNLALKAVSSSDAGTYYCALDSCGEIVFGKGTRVELAGGFPKVSSMLMYCLSVTLAISIIILLVLAVITYKMKKNLCSICRGTVLYFAGSASLDAMVDDIHSEDADVLHYAALSLNKPSKQHHKGERAETDCVYSRVRRK